MSRKIILLFMSLLILGCVTYQSPTTSESEHPISSPPPASTDESRYKELRSSVTGTDKEIYVSAKIVDITGMRNVVHVDAQEIDITGSDNVIYVENEDIKKIEITGTRNKVFIPKQSHPVVDDTGSLNNVKKY